ncbi:hypothetical protein CVV67_30630, partial [Arthrobacter stackebrandtii]
MKVTVFGTGYVGLTQAVCLAQVGHSVLCMDVDAERVATLNEGHCPIFEPGLAPMLEKNLACGRLRFTTDARAAANYARLQFIAVGTPPQADGSADLKQVFAVVDSILEHADGAVIVNKSTAPVGTVHRIKSRIAQSVAAPARFQVISNPEFLKEGSAVDDCMRPDRIIIGGAEPAEVALLRELYLPFSRNREKLMIMDARSAELTKYAANCMLATKISFINEIANLAEQRHAAHILIEVNDKVTDAQAKARAEEIEQRLAKGESFAALAKEFSQDPGSASSGGDLGFAGPGVYDPAFEDALYKLQDGQVSAPVRTEFGYHLIK